MRNKRTGILLVLLFVSFLSLSLHAQEKGNKRDVKYERHNSHNTEVLPVSRMCPDSAKINIYVLGYKPEWGCKLKMESFCVDKLIADTPATFDISQDGESHITFVPLFPQTVYLHIDKAAPVPLVIVPGDNVSVVMKIKEHDQEAEVVEVHGAMELVNHEVNVKNAKRLVQYNNNTEHIDSILCSGNKLSEYVERQYFCIRDSIDLSRYSLSTKEWLHMNNLTQYIWHTFLINKRFSKRIKDDLETSCSPLLNNPTVRYKLSTMCVIADDWKLQKTLSSSDKMTLYPHFDFFGDGVYQDNQGKTNVYNMDIELFCNALRESLNGAREHGDKIAERIVDDELRGYYSWLLDR